LPGAGASSPIVVGDRVILTCYTGYGLNDEEPGEQTELRRSVLWFNLKDGKMLRHVRTKAALPETEYSGFMPLHGYASSTPASDGKSVFVFFGRSGLVSLSLEGKLQWSRSVGTKTHGWGSGTSPVLYKNLVIVNASVESGSMIAFDKETGDKVWTAEGIKQSWCTPVLVDVPEGGTELVISMEGKVAAFDPADGKPLWHCEGIKDYVCPSVVADAGVVYAVGGRPAMGMAVRAGGRGDVTESHRIWRIKQAANVPSPLFHQGHLYFANESRGTTYCVNAKTGEIAYQQRLSPRPGKIYASPVLADGKIYLVSRLEGTFVFAAKPEFELLQHNEALDDSVFNASPVVIPGKLLLRSDKYLYCIGGN